MYEIFERLCKERGVTPYRVGEETGIKTSALSAWKAGRYKFKQEKLIKIADYFGVPVEYLMTGNMPEEQYYSPEAKAIAQDIHDDPELKALFHLAKKSSPEQLRVAQAVLEALLANESEK